MPVVQLSDGAVSLFLREKDFCRQRSLGNTGVGKFKLSDVCS